MELSQILRSKRLATDWQSCNPPDDLHSKTAAAQLVFQRHLGHRLEQPLSTKWQLLTEAHERCWICDRRQYSVIFWEKDVGIKTDLNLVDTRQLVQHIESLSAQQEPQKEETRGLFDLLSARTKAATPYICGSFTGWQKVKMSRVQAMRDHIDNNFQVPEFKEEDAEQ